MRDQKIISVLCAALIALTAASGELPRLLSDSAFISAEEAPTIGESEEEPATEEAATLAEAGDFEYEPNDTGITITKYIGSDSNVTIPEEIDGKKVTETGDSAFYNCTSLTSVTIPDGVTTIGARSFSCCSGLTSVTIPNSVTTIGDYSFAECSSLTSITLPDGVTEIGAGAFNDCIRLTGVTIPNGVTKIGARTFECCRSLTSITIPNSLTEIGEAAFWGCWSLTSIMFPDSVTKIGKQAFSSCESLTSITIPNSVNQIGASAFVNCKSLTSISVDPDNPSYTSDSGILYTKDMKTLITYPAGKGEKEAFTIPDGVTEISAEAFECVRLTSVTIPDSVIKIGNRAFDECVCLISITIPDGVTKIGENVFYNCTSLTSVTIPDSLTTIGEGAFSRCTSLTSITIPDSVTSIGNSAFYYCRGLTSVTIPKSVTKIDNNAFRDCSIYLTIYGYAGSRAETYADENDIPFVDLTDPDAPQDTQGDFEYEPNDTGITITKYIGSDNDVTIPEEIDGKKVTEIGVGTFHGCASLTSITIPDSVTKIGNSAFRGCAITSITIPNSVTEIGEMAFSNCTSLTSITIPDGVTTIGEQTFYYCISLTSVTISNSVTEIDTTAFSSCTSLTGISVDPDNAAYTSVDGVLYSKDMKTLITYPAGKKGDFTIPDGVTKIGDHAFEDCAGLTSIMIPDGVIEIGLRAFDHCTNLTSLTLPGSLTTIGGNAFWSSLTSIMIPESVTSIHDTAFYACPAVTIYGYAGSYAETFANEHHNILFVDLTILDAPRNIQVDENNNLIWDHVEGADGYEISFGENTPVIKCDTNSYSIGELENGTYTIQIRATNHRGTVSEYSEPFEFIKHGDSLFDKDNETTDPIAPPPEGDKIPETDRITSITINPAFNMKNKNDTNVELDLTKIKIKAKEIYDEAGLKRAEEALGKEIIGNKHYNLLDLTLLYNDQDFSNGYEGLVQVIIPLPTGHRDKTFSCYRLIEVNGKMTKEIIPGEQTEDSYIIYLEHFSEYALVADGGETGETPDDPDDKPETPDDPDDKPETPDDPDDKPETPDDPDEKPNTPAPTPGGNPSVGRPVTNPTVSTGTTNTEDTDNSTDPADPKDEDTEEPEPDETDEEGDVDADTDVNDDDEDEDEDEDEEDDEDDEDNEPKNDGYDDTFSKDDTDGNDAEEDSPIVTPEAVARDKNPNTGVPVNAAMIFGFLMAGAAACAAFVKDKAARIK